MKKTVLFAVVLAALICASALAQGGPPPGAPPFPGHSLVPAFARDGAASHDCLFFHHDGNRALRVGDYKLVSARQDQNAWELYNLATDRGEQHGLAATQPDRVRDMAARWQALQDTFVKDAGKVRPLPGKGENQTSKD